jgi:hypothetical protein
MSDGVVSSLGTPAQYISATRMHIADVLTTYPASAQYRGMLATVDDLFGALDSTMRCGFDGTNYFWQPSGAPEYYAGQTMASDITVTGLSHPTILNLSGAIGIGVTRKLTLSTTNVWPGARKRIITRGITSLLGTLQILNGVTNLLNLGLNNIYDVAVDFSGGAPQWVQI